ncbi:MAG: hypothetical protein HYZ48_02640 [Chlamydiales bacterium]|nr:hypothetical protein [Chlamydiales bacterium]
MAPFISEELFQILKKKINPNPIQKSDPYTEESLQALFCDACIVSRYPRVVRSQDIDSAIENTFSFIDGILHAIRNIRAEMQLPPHIATDLHIQVSPQNPHKAIIEKNLSIIQALVRIKEITLSDTEQSHPFSASALVSDVKLTIPLPAELKEKENLRLAKERDRLTTEQNTIRTQLANPEFLAKAPAQLIEKLRKNLEQSEKALADVMKKID